jgi:predicted permease
MALSHPVSKNDNITCKQQTDMIIPLATYTLIILFWVCFLLYIIRLIHSKNKEKQKFGDFLTFTNFSILNAIPILSLFQVRPLYRVAIFLLIPVFHHFLMNYSEANVIVFYLNVCLLIFTGHWYISLYHKIKSL